MSKNSCSVGPRRPVVKHGICPKNLAAIAITIASACGSATAPARQSTPPLQPTPPTSIEPTPPPAWPAFPDIAGAPVPRPTGDPVRITLAPQRAGETERHQSTSTSEIHDTFPNGTRFQRTETTSDVRVKILAAAVDHPTRLEVDTITATESLALGATPDTATHRSSTLFVGTYVVSAGSGGDFTRDQTTVTRPDGTAVRGRDQEELAALFGGWLHDGRPVVRWLTSTPLRLGDAILLDAAGVRAIGGQLPGTYSVGLVAADATTATYQLDVTSQRPSELSDTMMIESRAQTTLRIDRATGRLLELRHREHELQRDSDSTEDKFSTGTTTFTLEP